MTEYRPAELLECIDREIRYRERVYPRWVGAGKMDKKKADRELELMRQVRRFMFSRFSSAELEQLF